MEAIQRAIEPQQNAILSFSKLAAKLEGTNLAEADSSLADFRKSDKELRDHLYVLQVWRKFNYQIAHKLQMKKAGDFEDPDLVKLIEEWEKAKEKDRREAQRSRDAQKAKAFTPNNNFKRARTSGPSFSRGGGGHSSSPLATTYGQYKQGYGGYNSRGGGKTGGSSKADKNCFICGEPGHFFNKCPTKK